MAIGSFGSKKFEVSYNKVYTLEDLSMNFKLNVEDQDIEGKKPSTYIKGFGLDDFSFSINIFKQKRVSIENEINDWRKILNAKVPYSLIINGKPICSNKVLLTGVGVDSIILTSNSMIKAKLKLDFKEFVRWGKKEETSSVGAKTSSSSSKSTKKRTNKNASAAVSSKSSSKNSNAKIAALEKEIYK